MMINLANGRRINSRFVVFQGSEKAKRTRRNGETYEIAEHYVEDIEGRRYFLDWDRETETDRANIVPATTPLNAVEIFYDPEHDPPFELRRFPIIAWRIAQGGWPQPIYAGGPVPGDNDTPHDHEWCVVIELPGGAFQEAEFEGMWFANLEQCQEALRQKTARHNAIVAEEKQKSASATKPPEQ